MRPIILFLFLGLACCSCKSVEFHKTDPKTPAAVLKNCPELTKYIQVNWKTNKAGTLHQCEPGFIVHLKSEFGACLPLFTKQDIIDLFGAPNEDFKDAYLNYYLNDLCLSNSVGVCKYLSFIFDDKTGKLITLMETSKLTIE